MYTTISLIFLSLMYTNIKAQDENVVKMYKLSCDKINYEAVARNFSCHLKAVNRHKSLANMSGWLLRPLRNVTVHLQLFKYYSQFRPYLIDFTLNYCDIMSGSIAKNFYVNMFLRNIINTTNIVHECPIGGYIYARDLWMDGSIIRLPWPEGRYSLFVAFFEGYPNVLLGEITYFADVYILNKANEEKRRQARGKLN